MWQSAKNEVTYGFMEADTQKPAKRGEQAYSNRKNLPCAQRSVLVGLSSEYQPSDKGFLPLYVDTYPKHAYYSNPVDVRSLIGRCLT